MIIAKEIEPNLAFVRCCISEKQCIPIIVGREELAVYHAAPMSLTNLAECGTPICYACCRRVCEDGIEWVMFLKQQAVAWHHR